GINISSFDAFALKFTVLSANGVSVPDAIGPIIVGAQITLSGSFGYHPEVIEGSSFPISATSTTTTDADQINLIGFTCYIPYWWYEPEGPLGPSPWDSDGAVISLLVEPAPGAVVITPEPASLIFLGLGFVFLRRKL
ncbi:MAG: PEP-CTERM sorting domain-containing protein, partial [Phycisphaerae bacterium]